MGASLIVTSGDFATSQDEPLNCPLAPGKPSARDVPFIEAYIGSES
jgi:hypothetical protein